MTAKLITLNIEGHHHTDRFIPFLQGEQPEIVCLQEVFKADMPKIQESLGMDGQFLPMMRVENENSYHIDQLGEWGVALFTKLPHQAFTAARYRGEGTQLPEFANYPNSPWRVLLSAEIHPEGCEPFTVATTHFTWSSKGETTAEQRQDLASLLANLPVRKRLVLCGDFNAPRGRELHSLIAVEFVDAVPQGVKTTLDPELHYAGQLELVVDGIFHTPDLQVSEVRTVAGVSDHQALVGVVEG